MSVCSPITDWIPPTACSTEICWLFVNAQQRPRSRILTLDMSRCLVLVLTRLNVCWPTDRLQWLLHIKDRKQAMFIPFRPTSSHLNSIFKAQVPFLHPLFAQKVLRHPTQAPGQGGAPCRLVTDSLHFSLPWFLWAENVEKQIFRLSIYTHVRVFASKYNRYIVGSCKVCLQVIPGLKEKVWKQLIEQNSGNWCVDHPNIKGSYHMSTSNTESRSVSK